MEINVLRAELERLFDLEALMQLSRDLLGLDPESVGGTSGLGSYVRALTNHCLSTDSVEALCDAVVAARPQASSTFASARIQGVAHQDDLTVGAQFGPFTIHRKLGEGSQGISYMAKRDGNDHRLKVLRSETNRDRRGLQRFLTSTRVSARTEHPSLPVGVEAGRVGDRYYIAHHFVDGQPLSARLARTGPMHINEARAILVAIAQALAATHEQRMVHGNLKPENVLIHRDESGIRVLLQDAGYELLRSRRPANGRLELLSLSSPKTVAPEQLRGELPTAKSDAYAFGALMYETLTGKPLFDATFPMEAAIYHLTAQPQAPSEVAPRGWVSKEIEDFVLQLLGKSESARPGDFHEIAARLDALGRPKKEKISDEAVDERIQALMENPASEDAALALEAAADEGADADRVGTAFELAAAQLSENSPDPAAPEILDLLHRSGRIYQNAGKHEAAEGIYTQLKQLSPSDQVVRAALENVLRKQGKLDEVIESWLEEAEGAESFEERGAAMARIGELYAGELSDPDQALVAYTQAFCEDPANSDYAAAIESLATGQEAWTDVIAACTEASTADRPAEEKTPLFLRAGHWYAERLARLDLATSCFQAVLATDAGNDAALDGLCMVYRKSQQWSELGMILMQRADAAATPERARELRTDAADILNVQMNDPAAARGIYEQLIADDASNEKASEALIKIYERTGEHAALVRLLEQRVSGLTGEPRSQLLCRVAEAYEIHLNDAAGALKRFEQVVADDPTCLQALKGLDRIYGREGKFKELLENLQAQVDLASTPRQKIQLHERIAAIHDEEFLQPAEAALALEAVLALDESHDGAMTNLARFYRVLNRWDELADLYEKHAAFITDAERQTKIYLAQAKVLAEQVCSPERAIEAYEKVLAMDAEHPQALAALAQLRESAGDANEATAAIEALAESAASPEAAAELYLRAGRVLEEHGDRDAAIERYKLALDANPRNKGVTSALRNAYVARGDTAAAVELLERELEATEGDTGKAKLAGELAKILLHRVGDRVGAERIAKLALDLDPTNLDGHRVLGDVYFDDGRFLQAATHLEKLAGKASVMDREEAIRVLVRYVDALTQAGSTEAALQPMDLLFQLAPDDASALKRIAAVTFEHGEPARAKELYGSLLSRFEEELDVDDVYTCSYRLGEATRRTGRLEEALRILEEASDIDPGAADPLRSIVMIYEEKRLWEMVFETKARLLDVVEGDERIQLLIESGEIAVGKLNDRTRAAKCLVTALEERPDDRKLLTRLMQLYSEDKDWSKLVEVVVKLADFVEDDAQRAKYLMTAGMVSARELGELDRALGFYGQVLELDPTIEKALSESIRICSDQGNWDGAEDLLKRQLESATARKDKAHMLSTFRQLGALYQEKMGRTDDAIDAFEAALMLEPEDKELSERLAQLYASDTSKYLEKAVGAQIRQIEKDPYQAAAYKQLRHFYTEAKRADASWCLCQALSVLKLAEPDEERFYRRLRSEDPAYAQDTFNAEDWNQRILHPMTDPLLTSLFGLVQPAIIATRSQPLPLLGYDPSAAIDPAQRPYTMAQTLYYAAGVMGIESPPCFENPNHPGVLSSLHAHTPSIVLGKTAIRANIPPQAAAFAAGRHLALYTPGFYVRHLVNSGTGLKSWLFAAIKLISPQFPVTPDLEGHVREGIMALQQHLKAGAKDELARVVSKLLQNAGSLDLKRWVNGVDLTVDRVGFVLAHDLENAVEVIKATAGDAQMPIQERLKELILYAVSEPYFELRTRLQIGVDT